MSFMDKVKTGFSEAGSKAKMMVEVNKLKMQSSGKQKEIEKHYQEIGQLIFQAAMERIPEGQAVDYQVNIDAIVQLEGEIQDIKRQLKALTKEKECVCGKAAPLDARFCPACGYTFAEDN